MSPAISISEPPTQELTTPALSRDETAVPVSSRPGLSPSSGTRQSASPSATSTATGCEASFCTLAHAAASEPLIPEAQRRWAARPVSDRLQVIRTARHWMAAHSDIFVRAISPELHRAEADTLVAELLPLLEAMKFLERSATGILAPRKLGSAGRPLWLTGVQAEIHRDPLGHILIIGPSNFPLFLPGVQAVQALVAGNAVTWKPGTGGFAVAVAFAHALREAGLPRGVLGITDDSIDAAASALAQSPDKVVFTGSYDTGRSILSTLATSATPATLELSGADAVVVLPSADPHVAVQAVAFGLRLNGSEVCMSPRRLIATRETLAIVRPLLSEALANLPAVHLKPRTAETLTRLVQEAQTSGAKLLPLTHNITVPNPSDASAHRPVLVDQATPKMSITRTDLFAPVLSLIEATSVLHIADLVNDNPYALTAAIFGAPAEAGTLALQLRVGTVLINDLIAPTADPRIPFGGRGRSGFGVTRGAEGLLEMTAAKTILRRRKGSTRHYDPLGPGDLPLFTALLGALHGSSLGERWRGIQRIISAARKRNL